ncbi:glycosyltransferase family 4 protein [Pantoea sp. Aalb]|uniref:glycosyltransferase family 4 protein n=1 Tax=Pantoea sp. Aalb TaxID=2576762 RepID=UPI0013232737|nr:glycosyltransferase family 4 protein [Pantoea sp. Aalb]MXP67940.1 glycosyltransferase family 4 protein [Pantoea sp. Aalb]
MSKIRLAIVRQRYRLDGGAERFISSMLETLNNEQLELNIITRNWQKTLGSTWHIHICNPIKIHRILRERSFANAAKKYWEKEKFDIVQSHERIAGCDIFRAGDGVHRAWLEQRSRIKSSWQQRFTSILSPYHNYVLQAEANLFNDHGLKVVICNSKMVKQDILRYFSIDSKKIYVIYNTVNNKKFQPATEYVRYSSRLQLNLPINSTVMIYVGSGFERKGLKAAIEAIANSNRYLIIVGQDKKILRYKQLANQLNCLNRLRFVGIQKDVQPFYHAADALLLPTLYDPCPNVVLEAMSCGLSVITSTTCGAAEFIDTAKEGFVCDALDIKTLTDAILETPSLSENSTMGQAALCKVKSFNKENLVQAMISLYYKVLNR